MASPTSIPESSLTQSIDGAIVNGTEMSYRHIRIIGHGHSGAIEEVADPATGKIYARKTIMLRGSIHNKEEATRVFRNEVKIILGLERHHHIIRVHSTYAHEKVMCILLEPVAKEGDLDQYLADYEDCMQSSTMLDDRALAMTAVLEKGFGCLAAGLAFMHKRRIRHKDIKLHNILVHEGVLIYTDFGYSFDSNDFTRSTTEGPAEYLTRRYSAPEVIDGGNKNSKSDVFSLGCVFVDMFLIMNRRIRAHSKAFFWVMMNSLHEQILSTATSAMLDILPDIIVRMTALKSSSRLCSTHTAAYLLQRTNLHCTQCASTPIDDWMERVGDDDCPPLQMIDPTLGIQRSITQIAISAPEACPAELQPSAGSTTAALERFSENPHLLGEFSETQDAGKDFIAHFYII
jgi:serine/threonine protein kinase